jgi:hypothetical protein
MPYAPSATMRVCVPTAGFSHRETAWPFREKPQQNNRENGFHSEKFVSESWNQVRKSLIEISKKIIRCLI